MTPPQLLSGREMARRICVSVSTLISATKDGRVKADFIAQPGRRLLFRPEKERRVRAILNPPKEDLTHV